MGIVNLTPDSFFDGGRHRGVGGVTHALRLLEQGADIVDLGAESTRPGATPVSADEEMARLLPTLASLRRSLPSAAISVDTSHATTAAAALEMGAVVINDVSACSRDPALLDVLVQFKPGYVLMHGWDTGRQDHNCHEEDMRSQVRSFFAKNLDRLVRSGLPEERIVLDPGIGFGKTAQQNFALLAHPEDWLELGRPVVVGLSRKSLFGVLCGLSPEQRGTATTTATALLWERGVFWHRVHDVAEVRQALAVAVALRRVCKQPG
ncbi:MAG: dihydropteroate synthase [Desulfovibrio sp.]|nr:dihydropteroate synthase [Desulfovibrio sp.]